MGCGASQNANDIDSYMKMHHKGTMQIEKDNYELAKQDRKDADKNMVVGQSDLAAFLAKKQRGSQIGFQGGDNAEGQDEENKRRNGIQEIDEDLLLEMCKFSSMSTSTNLKKQSANGMIERKNKQGLQGGKIQEQAKSVVEELDINLDGDQGVNGRPRIKEEEKLPPQYESIDLNDPNDEVLFQGELLKYKAGYTPTFINRWVQVTEKAFKYYKSRCNAITCSNKPLMAIPVTAIKKVCKVEFELPFKKKEKEKYGSYLTYQFEIYLKDDFLDIYLKPNYEQKVGEGSEHTHQRDSNVSNSPGKGIQQSHLTVERSSSPSHFHSHHHHHKSSKPPPSPGKLRGEDGKKHEMTMNEMKGVYLQIQEGQIHTNLQQELSQSRNTYGAWSNREEEQFFQNKRLLFTTKGGEISTQWIEKLNALVTPE